MHNGFKYQPKIFIMSYIVAVYYSLNLLIVPTKVSTSQRSVLTLRLTLDKLLASDGDCSIFLIVSGGLFFCGLVSTSLTIT